jgi:hypothetical protein
MWGDLRSIVAAFPARRVVPVCNAPIPVFLVSDDAFVRPQPIGTREGSRLAARLLRRLLESTTLAFPSGQGGADPEDRA